MYERKKSFSEVLGLACVRPNLKCGLSLMMKNAFQSCVSFHLGWPLLAGDAFVSLAVPKPQLGDARQQAAPATGVCRSIPENFGFFAAGHDPAARRGFRRVFPATGRRRLGRRLLSDTPGKRWQTHVRRPGRQRNGTAHDVIRSGVDDDFLCSPARRNTETARRIPRFGTFVQLSQ